MARYVEGVDRQQVTLLPECLEDYIAEDNTVRVVEAFVEELDLAALGFARAAPPNTGRPAYHPAVLLKIFIYGYLNRIASSRRLERECQRNVELMWLTGRLAPDFKTIADFRRDSGPAIIDKGIPTAGLLAQVLVAKYADHLPLYRQENIFARAGLAIARSTLAQWVGQCGVQLQPLVYALRAELLKHSVLHADETPVAMLKPGNGKTHRAYLWSYCTTTYSQTKAVVFDFADSRGGQHARDFLGLPGEGGWHGSLVCDDFSGYKACFEMGVTEAGCLAHARRKFHELWVNHQSTIGERALRFFIQLYDIEREVRELDAAQRRRIRQERSRPVADAFHLWLTEQRKKVPEGSATAKAIDYSMGRWQALTRYIDDGELPADNNWVENQIRPIAIGRSNWLFAGSLRAGKRAAAVMSLVHSARLNGHDPYAYLKDILERLKVPSSRCDFSHTGMCGSICLSLTIQLSIGAAP